MNVNGLQNGGGPSGYLNIGSNELRKLFARKQLKSSSVMGTRHATPSRSNMSICMGRAARHTLLRNPYLLPRRANSALESTPRSILKSKEYYIQSYTQLVLRVVPFTERPLRQIWPILYAKASKQQNSTHKDVKVEKIQYWRLLQSTQIWKMQHQLPQPNLFTIYMGMVFVWPILFLYMCPLNLSWCMYMCCHSDNSGCHETRIFMHLQDIVSLCQLL